MNDDQYQNGQNLGHGQNVPVSVPAPEAPPAQNFSQAPKAGADFSSQVSPDLQGQISSLPPEANDIDLIEKEWVTHLKYIVDQTSTNPYLQQQEISKAKADYMRKRYNKDVKVAEG